MPVLLLAIAYPVTIAVLFYFAFLRPVQQNQKRQRDELVDMLVENVNPVQWADEVKLLVRQVWIENDGRVTVEGVIAASPSDSVDKLSLPS